MPVRVRDHGYDALVRRVFGFGRPRIETGILEADGAHAKKVGVGKDASEALTVLEVAIINEFGGDEGDNPPPRSFIRAWFDEHREELRGDLGKLMASVVAGKRTKDQVLALLGQKCVASIQARIAAGIDPANASSTIRRKGSSKPLIDTGQLRSSVSYRVVGGGER